MGTDQFVAWDDHDPVHSDAPMPYVSQAKINDFVTHKHRERIEGFRNSNNSNISNEHFMLFLVVLTCVLCAITLLRLSEVHSMLQQLAIAGRLTAPLG